jgi:hypothetical protein
MGAFDDIAPAGGMQTSAQPAAAQATGNAFDDITPPPPPIPEPRPGATAADRVQAGEAGFLKGAAYLATSIPDTVANAGNLVAAGAGGAQALYNNLTTGGAQPERTPQGLYHFIAPNGADTYSRNPPPPGSKPAPVYPSAPTVPTMGVSPVGAALTGVMDKNDITSTQPNRPDDAVSRYIAAATSVVPGVLSGGGGVGQGVRSLLATAPAAAGAQYLNDKGATPSAGIALQLASALLGGRGQGKAVDPVQEATINAAQEHGLVFPPATTNPTGGNKALETISGKTNVTQNASVQNQPIVNSMVRQQIGLAEGGALQPADFKQAKIQAAPGYDALRGYGQITAPANFSTSLDQAISQNMGAARMSAKLGDNTLTNIVNDFKGLKSFDSSDAMDAIAEVRDKASAAFQSGNSNLGKAYRQVGGVLEDAVGQHLQNSANPNDWDLLQNYQDSRRTFAQIATAEEATNPNTGNVVAKKLGQALGGTPYTGNMTTIARAEGLAPRAFAEPTTSPGVSHLGAWGALVGGMEAARLAHEYLPQGGNAAAIGLGAAAAVPAARMLSRAYLLGNPNGMLPTGQSNVIARRPGTVLPGMVAGAYTGLEGQQGPGP